ncbi:hypothetical protein ABW21_db0201375 [Orbilia brochopaga]|nr:hypothetical protein ABW21_db0201375 [Drechslerella brochopaga]
MTEPDSKRGGKSHPVITDPRFSRVHWDPRFRPHKKRRVQTLDSRFKPLFEDPEFGLKAKYDRYGRPLGSDKHLQKLKRQYKLEDEEGEDDKQSKPKKEQKEKKKRSVVAEPSSDEGEDEGDVESVEDESEDDKPQETSGARTGEKLREEERAKRRLVATPPSSEEEEEESDDSEDEEEDDASLTYDRARGEVAASDSSDDSDSESESVVSSEAEDAEAAAQEAEAVPLGDISPRLAVVNLDWDHVRSADLYVVLASFVPAGGKILHVAIYPSEFGKERMEREEMEGPPKEVFGLSSNVSVKKKSKQSKAQEVEDDDDQTEITEQTLVKEDTGEEINSSALRRYQLERLRYFYAVITCDTAATANAIYTECDGAEFATTANFFDLRFVPDGTDFDDSPRDECSEAPKHYRPVDFSTDALQHSKVRLTWDQEDVNRKAAVKEAFSRREVEEMDLQAYLASESDEDKEDAREAYRKLKERDRKKARKEKMKDRRKGEDGRGDSAEAEEKEAEEAPAEDLGFDDPFFENPEKANTDSKKARKQKKREEKERIAAEQASKREQLEVIMANDNEDSSLQHFNMNDIRKREKLAKLKGKAAKRMAKKRGIQEAEGLQEDYKMDVKDPRFSAIYEKKEFAIDPTNPKYKKTQAMEEVMKERRKRRAGDEGSSEKKQKRRK